MTNWTKEPPTEPGFYWWRDLEWQEDAKVIFVEQRGDQLKTWGTTVQVMGGEWWPERIQEPHK